MPGQDGARGEMVTIVPATVTTQLEFNGPRAGFVRRRGTNELILEVRTAAPPVAPMKGSAGHYASAALALLALLADENAGGLSPDPLRVHGANTVRPACGPTAMRPVMECPSH